MYAKRMTTEKLREMTFIKRKPQCVKEHLVNFPHIVVLDHWPDFAAYDFCELMDSNNFLFTRPALADYIIEWLSERETVCEPVAYVINDSVHFAIGFKEKHVALEFKLRWT